MTKNAQNVFVAAINSDIGRQLALRYKAAGGHVSGTYRNPESLAQFQDEDGIDLLPCDISRSEDIDAAAERFAKIGKPWNIFIGAVGQLAPIGPFFETDREEWAESVAVNSLNQLKLLHAIYPYRSSEGILKVAFLVGGGINNAFTNYSAYCVSKLLLIKMCELLDDEYPNVHAIAIGTGWVNTKIHKQTLNASMTSSMNYRRTLEFVKSGNQGTSYEDIFDCINWCFSQDRAQTGGRNFSVVHDSWKSNDERLLFDLSQNLNKFKLRRNGG